MSDSEMDAGEDQLQWRDTYFVWFTSDKRPTMKRVEAALRALPEKYELKFPEQDKAGNFETISLHSAENHVALEISYLVGDDLADEVLTLAEEIKENGGASREKLSRLAACDARFDIVQYEQIDADSDSEPGGDPDEMFDPSTLLIVLGALAKLVDGIGVDPQSGQLV